MGMEAAQREREIDYFQANQMTIVDECSVLRTQVESDNLCRYWHCIRKKPHSIL